MDEKTKSRIRALFQMGSLYLGSLVRNVFIYHGHTVRTDLKHPSQHTDVLVIWVTNMRI